MLDLFTRVCALYTWCQHADQGPVHCDALSAVVLCVVLLYYALDCCIAILCDIVGWTYCCCCCAALALPAVLAFLLAVQLQLNGGSGDAPKFARHVCAHSGGAPAVRGVLLICCGGLRIIRQQFHVSAAQHAMSCECSPTRCPSHSPAQQSSIALQLLPSMALQHSTPA